MKNKELKKPIPVELDDNALDPVSGGTEPSLDQGLPIAPNDNIIELGLYQNYKEEAEKRSN